MSLVKRSYYRSFPPLTAYRLSVINIIVVEFGMRYTGIRKERLPDTAQRRRGNEETGNLSAAMQGFSSVLAERLAVKI